MAWRRPGEKPLSEPMMVSVLTHICVTRPEWVKWPLMTKHLNCWQISQDHTCHFERCSNLMRANIENHKYSWKTWLTYMKSPSVNCSQHCAISSTVSDGNNFDIIICRKLQEISMVNTHITMFVAIMHTPRDYRQVSNIRRTQSPNINASRLVLQLSLPNPLKPGVKLWMKM